MWRGIADLLAEAAADAPVRCAVIAGAGEGPFTAGADLSELADDGRLAGRGDSYAESMAIGLDAVAQFPAPVIALIRGHALGAGYHLALACDFRIAEQGARLGVPAARYGLMFGPRHFQRMVAELGVRTTREVMLLGRTYTAGDALRLGLIDEVCAASQLEARVHALSAEISACAPLTVRASKAVVNALGERGGDLPADVRSELDRLIQRCYDSDDLREGIRAFFENRRPVFQGE
jgi:enoyl-CoA hydratase/carnithine racemase